MSEMEVQVAANFRVDQAMLKAAHFAAQKHAGQRRKEAAAEPYIKHRTRFRLLFNPPASSASDKPTLPAGLEGGSRSGWKPEIESRSTVRQR